VRLAVKLRVQNPNDQPIDYDGVALDLAVRGMDLASGVSDTRGTIPRYGESVIVVPVTVSAFAMARQVYSLVTGDRSKVDFVASGKLGGAGFGGLRFTSSGEFELPAALAAPAGSARRPPAP
jgi:LEA14-like dessication related protein